MSDIVERLDEPEAHYPGNFDTPKRANAMLSCLCQEAKDEIETLRQQLAASQAREVQLREAIECLLHLCDAVGMRHGPLLDKARQALALPQDTAALEAMIAKAGEVMRERCADTCETSLCDCCYSEESQNTGQDLAGNIRALPSVTLEDLQ